MALVKLSKPEDISRRLGDVSDLGDLLARHPRAVDAIAYPNGDSLTVQNRRVAIEIAHSLEAKQVADEAERFADDAYIKSHPQTRRQFLGNAAKLVAFLSLGASQQACSLAIDHGRKNFTAVQLEEILSNYLRIVEGFKKAGKWDPVYGFPVTQDFEGHRAQSIRYDLPFPGGIDSEAPIGTPVVPIFPFFCDYAGAASTATGGIVLHVTYTTKIAGSYAHLSRTLLNEGEGAKRNMIIALTGNTGKGPGGIQPPHLHWDLVEGSPSNYVAIDPERRGIEGKPRLLTKEDLRSDEGYSGIREAIDIVIKLYKGTNTEQFARDLLDYFMTTGRKRLSSIRGLISAEPAKFESNAVASFNSAISSFVRQPLYSITQPFPNPDIVKEDLTLPLERRVYRLPTAQSFKK